MLEKLPDAVGEALDGVRAGLDQTVFHAVDLRQGMAALKLTSLAFADHAPIPEKYTADGPGISPPLAWTGVPAEASELLLIVEDADSPTPQPLVHAITVLATEGAADGALAEGSMSAVGDETPTVRMGLNSFLREQWLAPDPPPGHGVHRYLFQVFALASRNTDGRGDGEDALPDSPGREAARSAIQRRGLASGCLVGTHERPSTRIPTSDAQAVPDAAPALGATGAAA
ncbi:MAG: YbhB/YbcL family Raf kinase inhibitor-like protein [Burkholderiaceae bacterium]